MQTNTRHREEEPQNTNSLKTSGKQLKQSNQLTLPRHDDSKTRKDTKLCNKNKDQTQNPTDIGGGG